MNSDLKRVRNILSGIFLKVLGRPLKTGQVIRSPGQDLNPGSDEYEVLV